MYFIRRYSNTVPRVRLAWKTRRPMTFNVPRDAVLSCLPLLQQKCVRANLVVNKYIRLKMTMIEEILKQNKDLKVKIIHLFRDPRAMLDSQLRKNDVNVKVFPTFVNRTQYMCSTMLRDHQLALQLKHLYPDTIFTLRYETLVDRPISTAKRMFKFLGLQFSDADQEFLRNKSSLSVRFPVWRRHIDEQHLQVVDRYCSKLYQMFGYIPLKSITDVQNISYPDHIDLVNFN